MVEGDNIHSKAPAASSPRKWREVLVCLGLLSLLASCADDGQPPMADTPPETIDGSDLLPPDAADVDGFEPDTSDAEWLDVGPDSDEPFDATNTDIEDTLPPPDADVDDRTDADVDAPANDLGPVADLPPIVLPECVPETCNGLDDDCDGATDEGLLTTNAHCGACEADCSSSVPPGGVAECRMVAGAPTCVALTCPEDMVPLGAVCVAAGLDWCSVCASDADCPQSSCVDGRCLPACACDGTCTGECPDCGTDGPCTHATDCDDGDECTDDVCLGGCIHSPVGCPPGTDCAISSCDSALGCITTPIDAGCDDGDPCTVGDSCSNGACVSGAPVDCDDGLACTVDACSAGLCSHTVASGACAIDGVCFSAGQSQPGSTCARCDPGLSQTTFVNADNDPCNDGDACTVLDRCISGVCSGSAAVECDDGNPCTTDLCASVIGCVSVPLDGACEDGDGCTINDQCVAGVCQPGLPLDCGDSDTPCVERVCVGGACTGAPAESDCDDGLPCTTDDVCVDGDCQGTPTGPCCGCDDDNPCTVDTCTDGACVHSPVADGTSCDDGSFCTVDDVCQGAQCGGPARACPQAGPCANGLCDEIADACIMVLAADGADCGSTECLAQRCLSGVCEGTVLTGPCEDGDPCTIFDGCGPTGCVGIPKPCPTGLPCLESTCNSTTGECITTPGANDCILGDPPTCVPAGTVDGCAVCDPGLNLFDWSELPNGTPCGPSDACVTRACDSGMCVAKSSDAACDDGDPCTLDDTCTLDGCTGSLQACDDGHWCTHEVCTPGGCLSVPNGQGCFIAGSCIAIGTTAPNNECARCVPALNPTDYSAQPDGAGCEDGDACTDTDRCVLGTCIGTPNSCDDDNACTDDLCVDGVGCSHTPNSNACRDGTFCTVNAECVDGQCTGLPRDCSGGVATCASDACNETLDRCEYWDCDDPCLGQVDGTACDDGRYCTVSDTCQGQRCQGMPRDCSGLDDECRSGRCDEVSDGCFALAHPDGASCPADGDPCTTDECALGICLHAPSTGPCSDGDPCTEGDTCIDGTCVGLNFECDDGLPCTDDQCGDNGCIHLLTEGQCVHDNACVSLSAGCAECDSETCDDGDACTADDHCTDGACTGTPVECDDGLHCTSDSCQAGVCLPLLQPGYCLIGGACIAAGAQHPTSGCEVCAPTHSVASWTALLDGTPCTPGDPCVLDPICAEGDCTGTTVTCDDGLPCTVDSCDSDGMCVHLATAGTCVLGGVCVAVGESPETAPCLQCGEAGPLAVDEGAACDDGDACTSGDRCESGACLGTPFDCDDANECTSDACESGHCVRSLLTGTPCDDGADCTAADTCIGGACLGVPVVCDDGLWCTHDVCAGGICATTPAAGCVLDGACFAPGARDPGNACRRCNGTSWVFQADGAPCDDGAFCTTGDTCLSGACTSQARDCPSTPCGQGACDETSDRCQYPSCESDCLGADAGGCDDGQACTTGDTCVDGVCVGTPVTCSDGECTSSACDPDTGECTSAPAFDGEACGAAVACVTGGSCAAGACVAIETVCDDGLSCTADSCDPNTGCTHTLGPGTCVIDGQCWDTGEAGPGGCRYCYATLSQTTWTLVVDGAPCADDTPCTVDAACEAGVCQTTPVDCDDLNECTVDTCLDDGSCVYELAPNTCQIGGGCQQAGELNPETPCQFCNPDISNILWVKAKAGASCQPDDCTMNGVCEGITCVGGEPMDADGDGQSPVACGGTDCDDTNPLVSSDAADNTGDLLSGLSGVAIGHGTPRHLIARTSPNGVLYGAWVTETDGTLQVARFDQAGATTDTLRAHVPATVRPGLAVSGASDVAITLPNPTDGSLSLFLGGVGDGTLQETVVTNVSPQHCVTHTSDGTLVLLDAAPGVRQRSLSAPIPVLETIAPESGAVTALRCVGDHAVFVRDGTIHYALWDGTRFQLRATLGEGNAPSVASDGARGHVAWIDGEGSVVRAIITAESVQVGLLAPNIASARPLAVELGSRDGGIDVCVVTRADGTGLQEAQLGVVAHQTLQVPPAITTWSTVPAAARCVSGGRGGHLVQSASGLEPWVPSLRAAPITEVGPTIAHWALPNAVGRWTGGGESFVSTQAPTGWSAPELVFESLVPPVRVSGTSHAVRVAPNGTIWRTNASGVDIAALNPPPGFTPLRAHQRPLSDTESALVLLGRAPAGALRWWSMASSMDGTNPTNESSAPVAPLALGPADFGTADDAEWTVAWVSGGLARVRRGPLESLAPEEVLGSASEVAVLVWGEHTWVATAGSSGVTLHGPDGPVKVSSNAAAGLTRTYDGPPRLAWSEASGLHIARLGETITVEAPGIPIGRATWVAPDSLALLADGMTTIWSLSTPTPEATSVRATLFASTLESSGGQRLLSSERHAAVTFWDSEHASLRELPPSPCGYALVGDVADLRCDTDGVVWWEGGEPTDLGPGDRTLYGAISQGRRLAAWGDGAVVRAAYANPDSPDEWLPTTVGTGPLRHAGAALGRWHLLTGQTGLTHRVVPSAASAWTPSTPPIDSIAPAMAVSSAGTVHLVGLEAKAPSEAPSLQHVYRTEQAGWIVESADLPWPLTGELSCAATPADDLYIAVETDGSGLHLLVRGSTGWTPQVIEHPSQVHSPRLSAHLIEGDGVLEATWRDLITRRGHLLRLSPDGPDTNCDGF